MTAPIDYLLISPAYPFRGGIADSTHELALALQAQGQRVEIWTFTQLYPKFLFPGTSPFSNAKPPQDLDIKRKLHAYNPLQWWTVIQKLKKNPPKKLVFRYHTPLLAPCYGFIAKQLNKQSSCSLLVDNWKPHESNVLDPILSRYLRTAFTTYITLSKAVAQDLKKDKITHIGTGFHPIANNLPQPLSIEDARTTLGWSKNQKIALFYGLVRPYKGLDLLLEAMAMEPVSKQNLCLAIVGEFYESLSRYTDKINALGLKDRIYLYPSFADEKRTQLVFSAANLLVLPYRTATQSGVVAQAYHFEIPLLVTHHPGLAEPILKDNTGWVCLPNAKAISETLSKCFGHDNTQKKANFRQSKDQYSWKNFVNWLQHFLDSAH